MSYFEGEGCNQRTLFPMALDELVSADHVCRGVAPNKFLAKIASDWRKPNGQFVIQPHEVQAFLLTLPVGRIPGVGKVTKARMAKAGIKLVGDIYAMELATLEQEFGSYAQRLYELARGIDHNPVVSNRVRK